MEVPTLNLVMTVLASCTFVIMPVGYQIVILNVPQDMFERLLNESIRFEYDGLIMTEGGQSILYAAIVAMQSVGALVGSALSFYLLSRWSRKRLMILFNNAILTVGCMVAELSDVTGSFEQFAVGRFIIGISSGVAATILPLFIQEISPPQFQGSFSCLSHTFLCLGITFGGWVSQEYVLGNGVTWHYLYLIPILGCAMHATLYPLFEETPRYNLLMAHDEDAALRSIEFYYGSKRHGLSTTANVQKTYQVMDEINEKIRKKTILPDPSDIRKINELTRGHKTASPVLMCALVNFASIFVGVMAVSSYSTQIFQDVAGLSKDWSKIFTVYFGLVSAFCSLPSLFFVERFGRKPLLMVTLAVSAVCNFLLVGLGLGIQMAAGEDSTGFSWAFIAIMICSTMAYNLGPGPLAYFIGAELVNSSERKGLCVSVGVGVNWISSALSVVAFNPLQMAAGSWSFLLFAIPTTLSLILLAIFLPETKPSEYLHLPTGNPDIDNDTDYFTPTNDDHFVYGTFD